MNRRFDDSAAICTRKVHVHQHLHLHIVDGMVSEVQAGSSACPREFTREALRRWDMSAVFPDTAVVVSELVTNALCHGARLDFGPAARGQVELSLRHRASHLVCAVTDPSAEPPVLRPATLSGSGGLILRRAGMSR